MVTALLLLAATITGVLAPAQPPVAPARVRTVFRVFDGPREVSHETRLRVRQAGTDEPGQVLSGPVLQAELEPGIYDAQAIRERDGRVLAVRWAERLVVMAYPDEGGRHLEVINFTHGYGALQVRLPAEAATLEASIVRLAAPAAATADAVGTVRGDGYLLLVAPAGPYDLRVLLGSRRPTDLTGLEIPPDRTRLRVLP